MLHEELGTDCRLVKPTTCMVRFFISARDLKQFPFIPDFTPVVLDSFADQLIELAQSNYTQGGLSVDQMNQIVQQRAVIDILTFYDQSEARITDQVGELIQSANAGQLDSFIDVALNDLMNQDKKLKGGTMRIAKDGYQQYLRKDGLERLNEEINSMIEGIVNLENEALAR